jgi:alpha-ketoglutarate-dependent taurine dioxygenase
MQCAISDTTTTLATILRRDGFAFLPGYYPNSDAAEVAADLGRPVALGRGSPVHDLSPRTRDETTSNTYSGLYGLGAFPYHTDLAHWANPPRYLLLRALIGYAEVPTMLVDSQQILAVVGERPLHRALMKPRRRRRRVATPLLRIYETRGNDKLVRWDETFVRPVSDAGEIGTQLFAKALIHARSAEIKLIKNGDSLIVDNWRMLHARGPVPDRCRDRTLQRVYMEHIH